MRLFNLLAFMFLLCAFSAGAASCFDYGMCFESCSVAGKEVAAPSAGWSDCVPPYVCCEVSAASEAIAYDLQSTLKRCSELKGIVCSSLEDCSGEFVYSSNSERCCVGGSCSRIELTCSSLNGTACRLNEECFGGEMSSAGDADYCCLDGVCRPAVSVALPSISCEIDYKGKICLPGELCSGGTFLNADDTSNCCFGGICSASAVLVPEKKKISLPLVLIAVLIVLIVALLAYFMLTRREPGRFYPPRPTFAGIPLPRMP